MSDSGNDPLRAARAEARGLSHEEQAFRMGKDLEEVGCLIRRTELGTLVRQGLSQMLRGEPPLHAWSAIRAAQRLLEDDPEHHRPALLLSSISAFLGVVTTRMRFMADDDRRVYGQALARNPILTTLYGAGSAED